MNTTLEQEMLAYKGFSDLLERAKRVETLFAEAGIRCPERLLRILESSGNSQAAAFQEPVQDRSAGVIARPPEADADWISIPVEDMAATSLVLAVLRVASAPLKVKRIFAYSRKISRNVSSESAIFNIGARLGDEIIDKTEEGWALVKPDKAMAISGERAWGPKDVFSMHEIAAHRRDIVCETLGKHHVGLTVMQLVDELADNEACVAPVSKDAMIADTKRLEKQGRIRKSGRMWKLSR